MTHANDPKQGRGALRQDQSELIFEEGFSFSGYERDLLCLNSGGKKFVDISGVSGIDSISDGRAAVFADFDNDGDLDVFMTTIQGEAHLLFRNNLGQENNYLRVLLEGGAESGRDAYGAVVRLQTQAGILTKIKSGGAGFLSQHDPRLLFGLGQASGAEWIEVTWPSGKVERFEADLAAGSTLLLHEGTGRADSIVLPRAHLPDPLTRAETIARSLRLAVGEVMPNLPLQTLDGHPTSLSEQLRPGRRTLINLWATWCAPCAREMPELERLRSSLAARGIDLVGLNLDTSPEADLQGFLGQAGVHYSILVGGVAAIERLYATEELTVPLSILLDKTGAVAELIPGWSDETRRRFATLAGLEPIKPKAPR
ncbi:MAG: redoxin family protein [Acidobacteria bacterium]|nr:redoxin family protein [Acidobacteriota bacterium]